MRTPAFQCKFRLVAAVLTDFMSHDTYNVAFIAVVTSLTHVYSITHIISAATCIAHFISAYSFNEDFISFSTFLKDFILVAMSIIDYISEATSFSHHRFHFWYSFIHRCQFLFALRSSHFSCSIHQRFYLIFYFYHQFHLICYFHHRFNFSCYLHYKFHFIPYFCCRG